MNRAHIYLIAVVAICFPLLAIAAGDKATTDLQNGLKKQVQGHADLSAKVKAYVAKNLVPTTDTAAWVAAVEAQNAKGMTLAQIQDQDKKWTAAEEELPIQKELMNNACAKEIVNLVKKLPAIKEAFVMDNQGANVCENTLTSDYWQGDEAKWKNSFNGGKGGVDVGKVKFDKSANANLQQVSLPIIGKGGKVIGAVTFGLSVDQT
jgi:hypothetical protein